MNNKGEHIEILVSKEQEIKDEIKAYALGSDFLKKGQSDKHSSELIQTGMEKPSYTLSKVVNNEILTTLRTAYAEAADKQTFLQDKLAEIRGGNRLDTDMETLIFLSEHYLQTHDVGTIRNLFDTYRSNIVEAGLYDYLYKLGIVEETIGNALTQEQVGVDEPTAKKLLDEAVGNKDDEMIKSLGLVINADTRRYLLETNEYNVSTQAKLGYGRLKYQQFDTVPEGIEIVKEVTELLSTATKTRTPYELKAACKLVATLPYTHAKDVFVEQIKTMDVRDAALPRLLTEFINIDVTKGGKLTLALLGSGETPDKMFNYLSGTLVEANYFTKNFKEYLQVPEERPYLKAILREYPFEINTVLDTAAAMGGENNQFSLHENFELITEAMGKFGSITPKVFKAYIEMAPEEREALVSRINHVKTNLFKNIPLETAIPDDMKELSAELVYLTYLPTGLSFDKTASLLEIIPDCTKQLARFEIPQEGYDFYIAKKAYVLKNGETLSIDKTKTILHSMTDMEKSATPDIESTLKILKKILNTTADLPPEDIGILMSLMHDKQEMREFVQLIPPEINEQNAYETLVMTKSMLVSVVEREFQGSVSEFLKTNTAVYDNLRTLLSNQSKLAQLKKQLSTTEKELPWDSVLESEESMAEIISAFVQTAVLKPYKQEVNKNIKKYTEVPGETKPMKAIVSKSVAAFFSKGSVGLCTAEDVSLFERDDYLQFTVVEDSEKVVANIQAYIYEEEDGSKSLILRGFNPKNEVLENMNIPHFCDQVLTVGKQFAQENGLGHVYITDQKRWAALSNKEGIANYMMRKYFKDETKKIVDFPVTSNHNMDILYEV